MPTISPYGSWKSPITSDLITDEIIGLGNIILDDEDTYWAESRPSEKGRTVVVRRSKNGKITDMTPPGFNVRTRVHEYGGGAYTVNQGTVYFANFADQHIYQYQEGEVPTTLVQTQDLRFADFVIESSHHRLICICEDHRGKGEEKNQLVAISLAGNAPIKILQANADFYASPSLSPDGKQLAWLQWNHPHMPWNSTELWLATIDENGNLCNEQCLAGGTQESVFQPQWSPDGMLYFVSDRTGWWNLYTWKDSPQSLYPLEAEFGVPQWVFAQSTYAFDEQGNIWCTYSQMGNWKLAQLDPKQQQWKEISTPYTSIEGLRSCGNRLVFHGGSPSQMKEIVELNLITKKQTTLRRSSRVELDSGYYSVAQPIEFATTGERTAHAFYYPPINKDFIAPTQELPPLLVKIHGGPTAATSSTLSLGTQFWTSRGFAVIDVNYGGSTGYGRAYHQRLDGQWGIVDVEDCVNAVRYLIEQGVVDAKRSAIRGGSAGGYTALAALTFHNVFQAGASHFGVSDLEALTRETHKFESRYLDRLIGSYPKQKYLYQQRSPIHHAEKLSVPVIFLQGLEDKIVPPNQSERMVAILRKKGIPVEYIPFEKEQHGFRQTKNIKKALESELYFYSQIFGFALADPGRRHGCRRPPSPLVPAEPK